MVLFEKSDHDYAWLYSNHQKTTQTYTLIHRLQFHNQVGRSDCFWTTVMGTVALSVLSKYSHWIDFHAHSKNFFHIYFHTHSVYSYLFSSFPHWLYPSFCLNRVHSLRFTVLVKVSPPNRVKSKNFRAHALFQPTTWQSLFSKPSYSIGDGHVAISD